MVSVVFMQGPLGPSDLARAPGTGARVEFVGVVRAAEGDGVVSSLEYEAFRPMAERQLRELGDELLATFGLLALSCEHSLGRVAVGGVSFRLVIDARHRKEALAAMSSFIDRMKADVAIWKRPVWAERVP